MDPDGTTAAAGRRIAYVERSEHAIAGSLLTHQARQIIASLASDHFYARKYRELYGAVVTSLAETKGDRPDYARVIALLEESGQADAIGGSTGLADLIDAASMYWEPHAAVLKSEARRRALVSALTECRDEIDGEGDIDAACLTLSAQLSDDSSVADDFQYTALGKIMSDRPPTPDFLLPGILPRGGLGIFIGRAGAGKTMLSLQLAVAAANGDPWCGLDLIKCRIGLAVLETPKWMLCDRLDAVINGPLNGASGVSVVTLEDVPGGHINLAAPVHFERVAEWIRTQRLELVVLDCFSKIHPAGDKDAEKVTPILQALDRLRVSTGAAILVIHHERKAPGGKKDEPLDAMRGATNIGANVDLVMQLDVRKGWPCLVFGKVRCGKTPDPIYLHRTEDGALIPAEGPADQTGKRQERIDALEQWIGEQEEPFRPIDAQRHLESWGQKVTVRTVSTYLNECCKVGGVATKVQQGRYQKSESRKMDDEGFPHDPQLPYE